MPALRAASPLLLLPLLGCGYLQHRLDDLHDSVLYRWHSDALGLAAEAKLGPLDGALGGWYAEYGWGKDTFWQRPGYVLQNHGIGIPFTTLGPVLYGTRWSRALATRAAGNHPAAPDAFTDVTGWLFLSDVFDLDDAAPFRPTARQRFASLFGVELGLYPLFWGARVGANAAELVDFALGWIGIDLLADDGVRRPPTLPELPAGG